jgi:ribosomal protein S18 acetylase RimI-like enzyme
MSLRHEPATPADAPAIAALRNATAADLTARHGRGWWSGHTTERGVRYDLRNSSLYVTRRRGHIVATFRFATKKPWAIDRAYFTKVGRPLYLLSLAVAPDLQRRGIGRACLEHAATVARRWPADAIFLDAFDHAAGAEDFYVKCGYRETGRIRYRGVPLIYFERLIGPPA